MKKRLLTSLILLALFTPVGVLSKPKSDPWLIVPGKSAGPITAKTYKEGWAMYAEKLMIE